MAGIAVNDLKNDVDLDTVKKAIALCDWQLEVRKMNDPIDADNKIAAMEQRIRRQLGKGNKNESCLKRNVNVNVITSYSIHYTKLYDLIYINVTEKYNFAAFL